MILLLQHKGSGNPPYPLYQEGVSSRCVPRYFAHHTAGARHGTGLGHQGPQPPGTMADMGQTWDTSSGQSQSLASEVMSLVCLALRGTLLCNHRDFGPRVHLGQDEIFANTTCLFILIFQDFHSPRDDSERGKHSRPQSTCASSFCGESNLSLSTKL